MSTLDIFEFGYWCAAKQIKGLVLADPDTCILMLLFPKADNGASSVQPGSIVIRFWLLRGKKE